MKTDKFLSMLLLLACAGLGTLVLLLSRQNQALKTELADRQRMPPLEPFRPGDPMTLSDLLTPTEGLRGSGPADEAQHRSLVLVFADGCAPCDATMPIWREMLDACPPSLLHVVGLSVQESDDVSNDIGDAPPFPVHALSVQQRRELLRRLPRLPASMLLDENGIVEEVWYGELSHEHQNALRNEICASG